MSWFFVELFIGNCGNSNIFVRANTMSSHRFSFKMRHSREQCIFHYHSRALPRPFPSCYPPPFHQFMHAKKSVPVQLGMSERKECTTKENRMKIRWHMHERVREKKRIESTSWVHDGNEMFSLNVRLLAGIGGTVETAHSTLFNVNLLNSISLSRTHAHTHGRGDTLSAPRSHRSGWMVGIHSQPASKKAFRICAVLESLAVAPLTVIQCRCSKSEQIYLKSCSTSFDLPLGWSECVVRGCIIFMIGATSHWKNLRSFSV